MSHLIVKLLHPTSTSWHRVLHPKLPQSETAWHDLSVVLKQTMGARPLTNYQDVQYKQKTLIGQQFKS